jgi:hypothetical protein
MNSESREKLKEAVVAYFKILPQQPPIETGESTKLQTVPDLDSTQITAGTFDSFSRKGQLIVLNEDQFIVLSYCLTMPCPCSDFVISDVYKL